MTMKVSIITAVYNRVSTVEDAITSVLSQDYSNIEYIVIDGASTDGTIDIIEKYRDRIATLVSEEDGGIYDALNKGLSCATGDVIGFLHSDDLFGDSTVISSIVAQFEASQTNSVYGNLVYVNAKDPSKIIRYWESGEYDSRKLKNGWTPPHPSFYIKRSVYQAYGNFDTSFKIAADYDITVRFLFKHHVTASFVPTTIVKMRVGGASSSLKNIACKMREDARVMKKNGLTWWYTLFMKNTRKIPQLFLRVKSEKDK